MKSLAAVFLFIFLFIPAFSQVNNTTSMLFQLYIELQKWDSLIVKPSDGHFLGLTPSSLIINFKESKKETLISALPEFYDLREMNYVSSARNQGKYGICWTFATKAAIDSNLLKSHNKLFDYTEKNLATCHGFELDPDDGDNASLASAYISRIDGPVTESKDPYSGMSANADCIDMAITYTVKTNLRLIPFKIENANVRTIHKIIIN